jgi:hypothetical protein
MEPKYNPESYPAWTSLDEDTQERIRNEASTIKMLLHRAFRIEQDAREYLADLNLSNEELGGLWCILESFEKTALNRRNH